MKEVSKTQARSPASRPRGAKSGTPSGPPEDHEQIARLAHSYWESRGGEGGSAEDDWHRAETELKVRRAAAK